MDGDVSGVRISPPVVEFHDTEPHNVHQLNVTVKNISKTAKSIRFYGPKTKYFQLRVKNPTKPVASGLCVPAVVEFETAESKEIKDRLVVTVDGDVIEIPLIAYPTQPVLEIESDVDFGNLVANSKTISKEISLINHGSKAGEFKIKYSGDKPIAIMPSSGSVPPKSVQLIKIEYVTKQAGRFEEIIKVKLEGQDTKSVHVKGILVDRAIEVLSIENEQPLGCVKFGSTYYGTDKTECALLYNNGPEPVNFVAVLDEDAIGQEMGVDLTRSTIDALKEQDGGNGEKAQGNTNVITSLITAIPNQGMLKPYQKVPVFFRFSPRWNASKEGWKSQLTPPPRKDFALFMRIQIIGSSHGFVEKEDQSPAQRDGSMIELAFTGTALPVLLTITPSTKYNFNECPVGEHADVLCTICNESDVLPAIFQFRKIAHFSCHPPSGKIHAGSTQDVIFSFAPSQIGSFKQKQLMDVIGQVADNRNPTLTHLQIIHIYPIFFSGRSDPINVRKNAKFNTGLTPYISNEVGMFVETTVKDLEGNPRNAVAGGHKSLMHRLRGSVEDPDAKVAFPNDRAQSIRPEHDEYRTIFTHTNRHSYVDPDYMLTGNETDQKYGDRNSYKYMLKKMRQERLNRIKAKEFKDTNNKVDIGIKSAAGLSPKYLTQQEIKPDPKSPQPPNADYRLLSSKELSAAESEAASKDVCEGLNAVPTTSKEKTDCKKWLTPQQLHQVVIGPPVLDFGLVCLRSVVTKKLNIVNNLDQYIHIVAEIDCRELRQSSPLSQVIPPKSKAHLPIVFESSTKGKFQRSVLYCVNGFYKHHVTVVAEVVPVALELSTDNLVLKPAYGLPAEAGFRGVITLKNKLNYPAEFTWAPNLGEKGTAFSIRPATGTVDAHKDLDCEVVWHPSYLAPEDGSFSLMIHGGQTLQLRCLAELGPTNVQFVERRIMFGQTPINITTTRTALLANTGQNHAYFQVMDPNPFPGLSVSPVHGVVPVGGHAELKVQLMPSAILKFDTRVQVAIKGGKTLELRMGGTVEPPVVDIDVPTFDFGGVYCGSGATLMFKLTNKAVTKAKLEFDLTRYRDFTLNFPGYQTQDDYSFQLLNPGMYTVTMAPEETIEGEIIFMPSEVAAYDFVMPVIINQIGAPSPAPTPFPPTPAPSNKNSIQHIINPRPQPVQIDTPRKHVIATALRQPLQLSTNKIEFSLASTFEDPTSSTGLGVTKYRLMEGTVLVNNSDKPLKWTFDLSSKNRALEEGILKFTHPSGAPFVVMGGEESQGIEGTLDPGQTQHLSVAFCPRESGRYECLIPVLLDDGTEPYQYLQVIAEMKSPRIWFDPLAIVMTPVPLLTEVSTEFTVLASQYTKPSEITVEVPEVECEDGSTIAPLTVAWSDGTGEIKPCCADEGQIEPFALSCKVIFSSPKPVSFSEAIRFIDSDGRVFKLKIMATADNCLVTCYPFLALHRTDHQIVCEQGASPKGRKAIQDKDNAGEAVFIPCLSPQHNSRPSTSATSSNFQISSSSYESSGSVTDSTDESTPVNRDGAMNKPPSGSEHNASRGQQDLASRSLGSAMFPDEDTEEGIFHMEVLLAVQRWFSSQGWPGGQFPIIIPHSLRCGISRKPITDDIPKAAKAGSWDANNLKKEFKTIYDMISNLSGRAVPGIPLNSPLPTDPIERVKQIFWQHATLLTFLRCQGACVASVKPEYLLETRDYHLWKQMQKQLKMELIKQGEDEQASQMDDEEELEEDVFEAVSKRAWTDILLQLFKTLVLAKVTPRALKNTLSPDKNIELPSINPDPLSSNIYGVAERILLSWLNHHYETYRERIWKGCEKGGVPPSRWIVNYDFDLLDGLVLGAVLGAHMPFLIKTHLQDMYSHPSTAEQCLHNALKVVNAMRYAGIDYDIQAIDITDPNPIALLMLCVHLFQRLPMYLPKATVDFTGRLHSTVCRQVKLSNPSGKPLHYQVLLAGHDARDFRVPRGDIVSIAPKSTIHLNVEFTSRFLRPAEAILVLVGHRHGSAVGSTLTFSLRTQIDNITPKHTIKSESPCYELEKINVKVVNPFDDGGEFRIVLVEASTDLLDPNKPASLMKPKEKRRRKIRAKVDHGLKRPETPPTPPPPKTEDTSSLKEKEPPMMSAFYCPVASVYLEPRGSCDVEIHFLPFSIGERQCSVIFLSESIGEFLYSIEATATLPLSSVVPFVKTPHSVRISSAEAAGSGKGLFGGDERVVYWKCESGQTLKESIMVPITNRAKERALLMAAQQHMTDTELHRRLVTGTLSTSSVTAKTVMVLSTNAENSITQAKSKSPEGTTYMIEVDSEFYKLPKKFTVPLAESSSSGSPIKNLAGEPCVELPISFKATETGHYPCEIVLRAPDDVRVYKVECTVNPEGSTAELDFKAPVHQSVTQEIPIVNMTNHDWPLKAAIEGTGFFGPPMILAKAYNTTKYPLIFKPQNESLVKGKLVLSNTEDGTDHVFHLNGKPQKPLALDHIVIKCEAKKSTPYQLSIPNVTKKKLCYRVESDLSFISGNNTLTVLPGNTGVYSADITPVRRGVYKGVVAFIAGKNPIIEVDSDGDEIVEDEDEESRKYYGYRIWYSLEIHVKPPPPERIMAVECSCHKKAVLEVIVRNPTPSDITLDVTIEGRDLLGESTISLEAGAKDVYTLTFAPAVIGKHRGSLIFYHKSVGEFWYDLRLKADSPPATTLPHMECDLGRWTKQSIYLDNPTNETLELIPTVSNTNNFSLERDNERPLVLRPHSVIEVPIHFMPSTLGHGDHIAKVIFHSEQLGEWTFVASGTGLLPQPQEPVSVFTEAGSNTTLIIPFRNPMDHAVLVDAVLQDNNLEMEKTMNGLTLSESAFCLLLKHSTSIRVGPKSTLDIPVCFAPTEMTKYEALCSVIVRKEDGSRWQFAPKDSNGSQLSTSGSDGLHEIRWLYPINGIPESKPIKDSLGAVIECKARDRVEERLEVTLSGVAPASSGPHKSVVTRSITPKDSSPKIPDGIVIGETLATASEFEYDLNYPDGESKDNLQNSVALKLVRTQRNPENGLVIVVFNLIYAPFKAMSHNVELVVRAATGGLWRFPVKFEATEPPVDDTITIEATGLNKESSVGFRLTSQAKHPVMYNAFFAAGSDSEFTVTPQTGELLPQGTNGTLLVIKFVPGVYGKIYQAKLVLQTPDMQWSYEVRGVLPQYAPPRGKSAQPMAGPHPDPRIRGERVNYIRENLKLLTTAVSSPVKGAPILQRSLKLS